jgi:hypothetical protein
VARLRKQRDDADLVLTETVAAQFRAGRQVMWQWRDLLAALAQT